jgi:TetR/AcrR family transcriptional regulator
MESPKKRTRNAERTRKAVLRAAIRQFAKAGFAGTSMRDVSQASGVSQPLIHHHFGSKKDLYAAVHGEAVRLTQARLGPALDGPGDQGKALLDAVAKFFTLVGNSQTMRRLCSWSLLEGDPSPWPGEREYFQDVRGRIEQAQADGIIRSDIQPSFLVVMASCLVRHWWEHRDIYAGYLGQASAAQAVMDGRPLDEVYLEQMLRFLGAVLAKQE